MTNLLALSVGDQGNTTSVTLPGAANNLLSDPNILQKIISTILTLGFIACLLLIIVFNVYNGYRYIISQGEKKEIEQVRTAFWNGIIGFILLCLSFLIVNLIGYFFGLNLLQINLP